MRLTHVFAVFAVLAAALSVSSLAARSALGSTAAQDREIAEAVFAGGCFWCVEADFDKLDGVLETTSGFAGGRTENPTYKEVTFGDTGHLEVVRVRYDPDIVSYRTLADYLLRHVDPTDGGGQFCDRGESYTTALFYSGDQEKAEAEAAIAEAREILGKEIATTIRPLTAFYPAEEYHQDYYQKNPVSYRYYRFSCGRDGRVKAVWGDAR